jgi:hypothetical protein
VLVVWEPILPTDWGSPSRGTLARISGPGAKQFWDPDHIVAQEMARNAKAKPSRLGPDCCLSKGFYWDDAIVCAAHSRWKDAPASVFWNGPVVTAIPGLEKTLPQ